MGGGRGAARGFDVLHGGPRCIIHRPGADRAGGVALNG